MKISTPNKPRGIDKHLVRITDYPEAMAKGQAAQQLVSRAYPRKEVMVKGVKLWLYSISWLARLSDKAPKTICAWEYAGSFPKPLLSVEDGYRWYTAAELEGYSKLIKAAGLRRGRYLGGNKQTEWLKQNCFSFKARLKEFLESSIGQLPTRHRAEDEFLQDLAKQKRVKMGTDKLLRLIKQ